MFSGDVVRHRVLRKQSREGHGGQIETDGLLARQFDDCMSSF